VVGAQGAARTGKRLSTVPRQIQSGKSIPHAQGKQVRSCNFPNRADLVDTNIGFNAHFIRICMLSFSSFLDMLVFADAILFCAMCFREQKLKEAVSAATSNTWHKSATLWDLGKAGKESA
jgi:hypothetical protein